MRSVALQAVIVLVACGVGLALAAPSLILGANSLSAVNLNVLEPQRNITFDEHAILIDGQRQLLLAATIHYPRSTPAMWPRLMRSIREAGLNTVDTYVFWNEHEQERGQYDFSSAGRDLRLFLRLAQQEGLYVVLRIGPYVCAEWNYGGFPYWLREVPGVDFRTWNEPFMHEMARFLHHTVEYVRDLFYQNGGPIILLQVENEYGLVEKEYGEDGHRYIEWAAEFAQSLNTSLPWFVCVQDNVPSLINTCNGFYCDSWLEHSRSYPNQPGMFTENWSGWFSSWGDVLPTRPAEDLAFATTLWFARGGTYNAYYMWHGGTNFGRMAGYSITTSYDYDAPLDEYGFAAEPKHSHLVQLHRILVENRYLLLNQKPTEMRISSAVESIVFGDIYTADSLIFLVNNARSGPDEHVQFHGGIYKIPRWSITIIKGPVSQPVVLYNTAMMSQRPTQLQYTVITEMNDVNGMKIDSVAEPVGVWDEDAARYQTYPMEQIFMTRDKSDYLWYTVNGIDTSSISSGIDHHPLVINLERAEDFVCVHWNGKRVGCQRGGMNLTFEVHDAVGHQATDGNYSLQILTQTLGLTNFGPHRQQWAKGLLGAVRLNGVPMTARGWKHQAGLQGEHRRYYDPSSNSISEFQCIPEHVQQPVPFVWYRVRVPAVPSKYREAGYAFALDMSSMGKGFVWMNGHSMGRYWNITGKLPDAPNNPYPPSPIPLDGEAEERQPCDYAGVFYADKCRNGPEGMPTQRYYHVPADWLVFDDDEDSGNRSGAEDNTIVVFEELGGRVADIRLQYVQRVPVAQSSVLKLQL